MPKYRLAAGACAIALLVAGCSSSSNGSGKPNTSQTSQSSSPSFPASSSGAQSGSDNASLTPADLNTKVLPAVLAQKTFHIQGSGSDGSGNALSFDIRYGSNGSQGTIGISGTSLKLLVIGTDSYLYGDSAFWQTALAGQSTAGVTVATVANKWVKVDATGSDYKELFSLLDPKQFLSQADSDTSTVSKVGNSTYQGQQVVVFKDSSDDSSIYIRRYGAPLPIAITSPAGSKDGAGSFTFTDYGKPYTVQQPPASEIFDLTKFQH